MSDSAKQKNQQPDSKNNPSEFALGVVTFILFLIFMSLWMYFGVSD